MFTMDVPNVPLHETPIILAQAATTGSAAKPQPDFILKVCREIESTGDQSPAMRRVDPAFMLKNYLERHDTTRALVVDLSAIKTTLVESAAHGNIFAEVDNEGLTSYHYDPKPAYVGKDRAVFMAELAGKSYRIEINLITYLVFDENTSQCSAPQLIKVKGKPGSASSSHGINSITVTFTNISRGISIAER